MKRLALAFLTLSLVVAGCRDANIPTSMDEPFGPLLAIVDGAHGEGGNPDFFFLTPLVPEPLNDPDFEPDEFNDGLSPVVQICELSLCPDDPVLNKAAKLKIQRYGLQWKTKEGDAEKTFRIRVLVGSVELGFADVELLESEEDAGGVPEGTIPVVAGKTVDINFSIENGALCSPPGRDNCASTTVDLGEETTVMLPSGDRLDIPAQEGRGGEQVTITLEDCADFDNLPIDLPLFGGCFDITADPPLTGEQSLAIPAVFSICGDLGTEGLTEEQEDFVTLHELEIIDGDQVFKALPHAVDFCDEPEPTPGGFIGMAQAKLRSVWDGFIQIAGPEPLLARTVLVNRGAGGSISDLGSSFQFALPAKMDRKNPNHEQRTAVPGSTLPVKVQVTDSDDNPVEGATVHFTVTLGNGSVDASEVVTGADGIAFVAWTIEEGANTLTASGVGLADPADDGPFIPDIFLDTEDQVQVLVGTGELLFSATGEIP